MAEDYTWPAASEGHNTTKVRACRDPLCVVLGSAGSGGQGSHNDGEDGR
jgi:hypothetical protein